MRNLHNASIKEVCLVLFLTAFLAGCAGNSPGGGYDSPRALIKAVHAATISGDFEALRLCVDPRYRDRSNGTLALLVEYSQKADVGAKLIEEKLGKEVANRFRQRYLWPMWDSPFDDGGKKGQIQWKRIDIRVEAEKAWVYIDGKEVGQAIQNPSGRWFSKISKSVVSPENMLSANEFITYGIEKMDGIIRELKVGRNGEEYVLTKTRLNESNEGIPRTEAIVNARMTKLLRGTKAVGTKSVRMLATDPFEAGGFTTSVTIKSELKNCNLEVIYANPVDTEVSISIDARKPIRLRLPKTPQGGKARALAFAELGPLSEGKHRVNVYTTHKSGVSQLDWILFARTQWEPEETDDKHQAITMRGGELRQWSQEAEAIVYVDLNPDTTELLLGTTAIDLPFPTGPDFSRTGVRMLAASPFEAGGLVTSVTVKSDLKNGDVSVSYANLVNTEVSIAIDDRKPIKVRLPKTGPADNNYGLVFAKLGPLSKGKHKVHVYASHSSGVSKLGPVMIGPR